MLLELTDVEPIAIRLALDLIAITAVLAAVRWSNRVRYYDLLGSLLMLNVSLLVVTLAVTRTEFSLGRWFGLLALLSIIRLRSKPVLDAERRVPLRRAQPCVGRRRRRPPPLLVRSSA